MRRCVGEKVAKGVYSVRLDFNQDLAVRMAAHGVT